MLTFLPLDEIKEMQKWEGADLNKAKAILAYNLTELVHGKEEADKCETTAKQLFTGNVDAADMPKCEVKETDLNDGKLEITKALVLSKLCTSGSDARRNIEQGGVLIDDVKVTDVKTTIEKDKLKDKGVIIKKGKKNFIRLVLSVIIASFFV